MFKGHWLVADADGTLVPTPTKAGGKYFSLAHSATYFGPRYRSCLAPLRLFIQNGGSLCVVSTAGRRLWDQLYEDLSGSLVPPPPGIPHPHPHIRPPPQSPSAGALLLCVFTGAALFRSRAPDLVWRLCQEVNPPLTQLPPPANLVLEEWREYRLQAALHAGDQGEEALVTHDPAGGGMGLSTATTLPNTACQAAAVEGQAALVRFFEHVSYTCGHDITRARTFFEKHLSTKYHAVFTAMLESILDGVCAAHPNALNSLADGAVPHLCFAHSPVLDMTVVLKYGCYLQETNDALVDLQAVPLPDATVPPDAPVAQVVVMGIPMRFCSSIFPRDDASAALWHACPTCAATGRGAVSRLEALGLEVKPQPNSVCVRRCGVDKGTCVRWLMDHGAEMDFALERALSLGDVPESVDRPLTLFPPMQFISVSPKIQQQRLDSEGAMYVQPDPVQSGKERSSSPALAPLMLVGGEEEGTALFLEELVSSCIAEACERAASATAHALSQEEGNPMTSSASVPLSHNWFSAERVQRCVGRARARLQQQTEAAESRDT